MDQFTPDRTEPDTVILTKSNVPGQVEARFRHYMKIGQMPRMVTRTFRNKLYKEGQNGIVETFPQTQEWFAKSFLPLLEESNKQPLSDEVIDWLTLYLLTLIEDDKYRNIPPDAVMRVSKFANDIATRFNSWQPPILTTNTGRIVWHSMVLFGANGREFAFSGEEFSKASTKLLGKQVHSMSVYRIIYTMLKAKLISQIKKGYKNGRCGTYKLADDYQHLWHELGCKPKDGNYPIADLDIQRMFPWIFPERS